MKFKDLPVGAVFRFASETDCLCAGMAKGPWKKLSARRYRHQTDTFGTFTCRVGSINVSVVEEGVRR